MYGRSTTSLGVASKTPPPSVCEDNSGAPREQNEARVFRRWSRESLLPTDARHRPEPPRRSRARGGVAVGHLNTRGPAKAPTPPYDPRGHPLVGRLPRHPPKFPAIVLLDGLHGVPLLHRSLPADHRRCGLRVLAPGQAPSMRGRGHTMTGLAPLASTPLPRSDFPNGKSGCITTEQTNPRRHRMADTSMAESASQKTQFCNTKNIKDGQNKRMQPPLLHADGMLFPTMVTLVWGGLPPVVGGRSNAGVGLGWGGRTTAKTKMSRAPLA